MERNKKSGLPPVLRTFSLLRSYWYSRQKLRH